MKIHNNSIIQTGISFQISVNQPRIGGFFSSDKVNVTITKQEFKTGILKLVAEEGCSFKLFESSAFKVICGEMAEKLQVN